MCRVCPYCGLDCSDVMSGKQFSSHVRWCTKSPKNSSGHRKEFSDKLRNAIDRRLGEEKEFTVHCHVCGKEFVIRDRERNFLKKRQYFCSRSCANTRKHTEATKNKIKDGLRKYNEANNRSRERRGTELCVVCGKPIPMTRNFRTVTCSDACSSRRRLLRKYNGAIPEPVAIREYRVKCAFKFSIKDYPEEFDFSLVRKYGWYSPSNKKNNISGVSRDHMYSVMEGYRNKVDPLLLAHPANCRLLVHSENISKLDKSSITLEDLKIRIAEWDKRYDNKLD